MYDSMRFHSIMVMIVLFCAAGTAQAVTGEAAAFDPPLPALYLVHARQYKGQRTIAELEQTTNRSRARGWDNLGYAYLCVGRYRDAVAALEQSIRISDQNTQSLHYLGIAYAYEKSYKLAIQSLKSAMDRDPYDADIQINLGIVLLYAGELDKAIARLEKALDRKPRNARALYFYLYAAYGYKGEFKAAERIEEKARRWGEEEHRAYYQQIRQKVQREIRKENNK